MKFIVSLLLTALLAFGLGAWLEWWSLAIAAFLVAALIPQRPLMAWLSGFLGLFLLWAGLALFINGKNGGVFGIKMAFILPFHGNAYLLIFATAIIGGLIAGVAALTGSYARALRPE